MTRPPPDITPAEFFERWLPAQLPPGAKRERPTTVRVRLDGDGGGAWDLTLGPSGLVVAAAGDAAPDVETSQSVDDWRALVAGDLLPAEGRVSDLMLIDPAGAGSVKAILRFEVTGYHGRTWQLTIGVGKSGAPPDATISIDAETYGQILARVIPAPAAFFNGKLKITGDMNLAMQLGMALMPRAS